MQLVKGEWKHSGEKPYTVYTLLGFHDCSKTYKSFLVSVIAGMGELRKAVVADGVEVIARFDEVLYKARNISGYSSWHFYDHSIFGMT